MPTTPASPASSKRPLAQGSEARSHRGFASVHVYDFHQASGSISPDIFDLMSVGPPASVGFLDKLILRLRVTCMSSCPFEIILFEEREKALLAIIQNMNLNLQSGTVTPSSVAEDRCCCK